MNEFAFRAWDKINNKMVYKVLVGNTDTTSIDYVCSCIYDDKYKEWVEFDEHCGDIMQWTGLYDYTGLKIYENDFVFWFIPDILKDYKFIGQVIFYGSAWRIEVLHKPNSDKFRGGGNYNLNTYAKMAYSLKVVGNIYETSIEEICKSTEFLKAEFKGGHTYYHGYIQP